MDINNNVLRTIDTRKGNHMERRIKFRHLDAFSAIARARSLKRAAGQLNLTSRRFPKPLKSWKRVWV